MKCLLLLALAGALTGCASPSERLFEANAKACPSRCRAGWTGWVQVEPRMIVCVCKDDESFRETK